MQLVSSLFHLSIILEVPLLLTLLPWVNTEFKGLYFIVLVLTSQRRQPSSTLEFESADGRSLAEQPAGKSIRLSPLEGSYKTVEPQVPSSCSKSSVSFSGTRRRRVAGPCPL